MSKQRIPLIANKMKTVHNYNFIKALFICKLLVYKLYLNSWFWISYISTDWTREFHLDLLSDKEVVLNGEKYLGSSLEILRNFWPLNMCCSSFITICTGAGKSAAVYKPLNKVGDFTKGLIYSRGGFVNLKYFNFLFETVWKGLYTVSFFP